MQLKDLILLTAEVVNQKGLKVVKGGVETTQTTDSSSIIIVDVEGL